MAFRFFLSQQVPTVGPNLHITGIRETKEKRKENEKEREERRRTKKKETFKRICELVSFSVESLTGPRPTDESPSESVNAQNKGPT